MGLFRRANKLLRFGTGLRNCCCRPEQPSECFCPEVCRYYFRYADLPALSLFGDIRTYCQDDGTLAGDYVEYPGSVPYGLVQAAGSVARHRVQISPQVFSYGFGSSVGLRITYTHFAAEPSENFNTPPPIYSYNTRIEVSVYPLCQFDYPSGTGETKSWAVEVFFTQNATDGFSEAEAKEYYGKQGQAYFEVPGTCVKEPKFFCDPTDPQSDVPRLHLLQDVQIAVTQNDVTVNGFTKPLENIFSTSGGSSWPVGGDYPFAGTANFRLQGLRSCQIAACNCNASLTNRLVEFEGRTFRYGALEQFVSDDGLTIWEEFLPGIFIRDDRRECDPTTIMRRRKAEVVCGEFEGVQRWYVLLDSECYERNNPDCSPVVTGSKISLFSGAFFCDENGDPSGSPHSFLDDSLPPDLDQETSDSTTGDCAFSNPIPSISFRPT